MYFAVVTASNCNKIYNWPPWKQGKSKYMILLLSFGKISYLVIYELKITIKKINISHNIRGQKRIPGCRNWGFKISDWDNKTI